MPWYKIDIRHGGGHMGHTVRYVWSDRRISEKKDPEEWHYFMERECEDFRNVSATMSPVSVLPREVRKRKIKNGLSLIRHGKEILKRLKYVKGENLEPVPKKPHLRHKWTWCQPWGDAKVEMCTHSGCFARRIDGIIYESVRVDKPGKDMPLFELRTKDGKPYEPKKVKA